MTTRYRLSLIILALFVFSCKKFTPEPTGHDDSTPEKLTSDNFFINFGGTYSFANDMATDAGDNVYITGYVSGQPGSSVNFGSTMLQLAGDKDVFLAKYDKYGNAIWGKLLGGPSAEQADAIAVDDAGNSYIAGNFRDTTTMDGIKLKIAPLKLWGSNDNLDDMFISKYDKNGKQLWVKAVAGSGNERPQAIAIDKNSGKIYVTGYYVESIYFGDVKYTTNGLATFIACYNSDGQVSWARSIGDRYNTYPGAINITGTGDVVLTGSFSGPQYFGDIMLSPETGTQTVYTAKLSSTGTVLWAKQFIGNGDNIGYSQTLDAQDNIYLAGSYRNTLTFGSTTLGQQGTSNAFLTRLDENGNVTWARSINGTTEKAILNVKWKNNKLYTAGYLTSPGIFGDTTVNASGGLEGFAARYADDGTFEKVEKFNSVNAYPQRIAIDNAGNTVLFGTITAPLTLNQTIVAPIRSRDLFIYKLKL